MKSSGMSDRTSLLLIVTDVSEELSTSMFWDKQSKKRHVVAFHEGCIVHLSFSGSIS